MNYTFWIPTVISVVALFWNYVQSRQIIHIQTKAEGKRLIHKFQFEKEFSIYTELWTNLIDLRNAAASLRPIADFVERGKSEEEIRKERLEKWNTAHNVLVKIFQYNRPFYSREIYIETENVIKTASHEAIAYSYPDKRNKEYWEEGERNIKLISDSVENIFTLIRKRIEFVEGAMVFNST